MTLVNCYIALEDLQDTLSGDAGAGVSTVDYEMAISAASRWIDARCSDPATGRIRHFWQEPSASARLYRAQTVHLVQTCDFASTSGVTVEVDTAGTGTWTTLPTSSWQAEPLVRLDDYPYTQITAAAYTAQFPLGLKPQVRVTAQWGWAAVPDPVKQACQILSVAYLAGKEVISMHDGYDVDSQGPANPVAMAEHLLKPYLPVPINDPALPTSRIALP